MKGKEVLGGCDAVSKVLVYLGNRHVTLGLVKVTVLGVGGGLGSDRGTSAVLVNDDTLIDVGSGIEGLSLAAAQRIRRVFLTHAHMDHISGLPLLVETVFDQEGATPLSVFALPEVLELLRKHIFNGEIWPDFEKISHQGSPGLILSPLKKGEEHRFSGFSIRPFPTHHDVSSCGFCLETGGGNRLVVTGDTGYDKELVETLNGLGRIDVLLTECSLPNRLSSKADQYFHLTPSLVEKLVEQLHSPPGEVWLSHLKPGVREEISPEVRGTPLNIVEPGKVWEL